LHRKEMEQGKGVLEDFGNLGAGGGAQQGGQEHADQGQEGLELLHHLGEALVSQHAQQSGHQHHLEG
jgi:aminoglycoside/choline kinase family phosphotransferase